MGGAEVLVRGVLALLGWGVVWWGLWWGEREGVLGEVDVEWMDGWVCWDWVEVCWGPGGGLWLWGENGVMWSGVRGKGHCWLGRGDGGGMFSEIVMGLKEGGG